MVIANAARPLENVRANSLGVVHGASRNSLTPLGSLGNDFQAGALDRYERRARSGANLRSAITTPPGRHGGRNNQLKNTFRMNGDHRTVQQLCDVLCSAKRTQLTHATSRTIGPGIRVYSSTSLVRALSLRAGDHGLGVIASFTVCAGASIELKCAAARAVGADHDLVRVAGFLGAIGEHPQSGAGARRARWSCGSRRPLRPWRSGWAGRSRSACDPGRASRSLRSGRSRFRLRTARYSKQCNKGQTSDRRSHAISSRHFPLPQSRGPAWHPPDDRRMKTWRPSTLSAAPGI